jgi:hypothetical protein
VRILEVVAAVGEPARNRVSAPTPRRDAEAAQTQCITTPQSLVAAYRGGRDEAERTALLAEETYNDAEAADLCRALEAGDRPLEEIAAAWCERQLAQQEGRLRAARERAHHKLTHDARYRRDRRWKRQIDEE